jgi:O-antigen/teichoic acid export membrane protein
MQVDDLGRALPRHARAVVLVFVVVVVACLGVGRLTEGSSVASASALVQPTSADLGTEQYVLAVLPPRIQGEQFHRQVAEALTSQEATAKVELRAQTDQTSGVITVTATGLDPKVTLAWANAALSTLAAITPVEVSQGIGIITLSQATLTSSLDRKASAVDALGLAAMLAILTGILLEASGPRRSPSQRMARRSGLPVLTQVRGAPGPVRQKQGREISAVIDGAVRPVLVLIAGDRQTNCSAVALHTAYELAALGRALTVISPHTAEGGWAGPSYPPASTTPLVELRRIPAHDVPATVEECLADGRTVVVASPPFVDGEASALSSLVVGAAVLVTDTRNGRYQDTASLTRRLRLLGLAVSGILLSDVPVDGTHSPITHEMPPLTGDEQRAIAVEAGAPRPASSGLPARLVRNVLSVYGTIALAGVSLLFITPFALHRLGRDVYGVYALLQTVSEYILLGNVGFGTATLKLVAEDAGRDNRRVLRTFNTSVFVLTGFGAVVLLLSLVGTFFLPTIFGVPQDLHRDTIIAFAILAVAVAPQLPGSALTGILMGFQRYDIEGLLECVGIFVTGAGTILAISLGGGLIGAAIAIAAGYLVMVVIPWFPARRLVPELHLSRKLIDRSQLRRMTALSGWYLIENVSNVVSAEADLVLVGALLGLKQVAVFAVAFQLSRLATKAIGPFQAVFFPHVSSVSSADEDRAQLRQILRDGTRVTLAVAVPAGLIVAILARPAIGAWVGQGFSQAAGIVVLLTAAGAITAFATVGTQILVGLGQARSASLIGGATAVAHIVLAVGLAGRYGTTGVALGALLSVGLIYAPTTIVIANRLTGDTLVGWFTAAVLPHVPAAVVLAVVLAVSEPHLSSSVPDVVGAGALAFFLYLMIYLFTGGSREERSAALSRFRRS